MPTAEEKGKALAKTIASFHAELLKQGIDKQFSNDLASKLAGAADSNMNGSCSGMLDPMQKVTQPE